MLKIEIDSMEVQVKSGTSRKGAPYSMEIQKAWCHAGKQVFPVELTLAKGAAPYPLGTYSVSDETFAPGPYGSIKCDRVVLGPRVGASVPASVPARAAG